MQQNYICVKYVASIAIISLYTRNCRWSSSVPDK